MKNMINIKLDRLGPVALDISIVGHQQSVSPLPHLQLSRARRTIKRKNCREDFIPAGRRSNSKV